MLSYLRQMGDQLFFLLSAWRDAEVKYRGISVMPRVVIKHPGHAELHRIDVPHLSQGLDTLTFGEESVRGQATASD